MNRRYQNPLHNPDSDELSVQIKSIDAIIDENTGELIPILQQVQQLMGYLPRNALRHIARRLDVSMSDIYGILTYYNRFRLTPVGKYLLRVCRGTTCHIAGADKLRQAITNELGIDDGETTADKMFTLDTIPCVGCCSLAPVVLVNADTYGRADSRQTLELVDNLKGQGNGNTPGSLQGEGAIVPQRRRNAAVVIQVGMGACGISAGAIPVYTAIERELAKKPYRHSISLHTTGCEGACYEEVLVNIRDSEGSVTYQRVTPERVATIFERHIERSEIIEEWAFRNGSHGQSARAFYGKQSRNILRNCGKIDPGSIDDYMHEGGYEALKKVLTQWTRESLISEISRSQLRGRGGAGFPAGTKWRKVQESTEPTKYVICNADEGDPGAFMDRNLIESDPHSVIEGLMIAGYAVGSSQGYFYIREEYPVAIDRLSVALKQAEERGLLGENIMESGFSFHIAIKEGAGAFVCGEETALIQSLEGKRGIPRARPPYPAEFGLWGKPTLINNVETLANVTRIILHGADAYLRDGTDRSKGTKIFTLAGSVKRSGMIEVPMGTSIRDIVYDIGGGSGSGRIKAVHIGGPSGGCLPERLFDTPIDFDRLQEWGTIMGSGGLLVMDDTTCMVDLAKYFLEFTQNESCGKCTPCRVGTKRMYEILDRITRGEGKPEDLQNLEELAAYVQDASLCGLGQTAPNPVITTLKYFREEYEDHIFGKKCPAMKCKALIAYQIDVCVCEGCTVCAHFCQVDAIAQQGNHIALRIDPNTCTHCGGCYDVCHFDAVSVIPAVRDVTSSHHN